MLYKNCSVIEDKQLQVMYGKAFSTYVLFWESPFVTAFCSTDNTAWSFWRQTCSVTAA